jgi:hypothetical protein
MGTTVLRMAETVEEMGNPWMSRVQGVGDRGDLLAGIEDLGGDSDFEPDIGIFGKD